MDLYQEKCRIAQRGCAEGLPFHAITVDYAHSHPQIVWDKAVRLWDDASLRQARIQLTLRNRATKRREQRSVAELNPMGSSITERCRRLFHGEQISVRDIAYQQRSPYHFRMTTHVGFNPQLVNAREALKALCSPKPFADRASEAKQALSRIVAHPVDLDPEIVSIIKDALDENLTPNECGEALAGALGTIYRLVPGHC